MIKLNLIETQVPTKVDLPKKIKKKQRLIALSISAILIFFIVLPGMYILKSTKTKKPQLTKKTKVIPKIIVKKTVKKKEKITLAKRETKKKKVFATKEMQTKQKGQSNHTAEERIASINNEKIKKIKEEVENKPIFSVQLNFESIPKTIYKEDNSSVNLPPLPTFLPKKPTKKIKIKQRSKPFYLVTVKTFNSGQLKALLNKYKIKFTEKNISINRGFTYNVYVGGFYALPQIIQFAKALKEKGYKIYAIKNINLLYFVCIDKNIGKRKKEAYEKIWSKTKFKITFLKKPIIVRLTVFNFTTTNRALIKLLKKRGFYPIIKQIKHGA